MQDAYEDDALLEKLITGWHAAVDRRDAAGARALVSDPVEVSGPRGARTITAQQFADWIVESGIRLRPLAAHRVSRATMVVEQEATWPDHRDPAAAATPPTPVATVFELRGRCLGAIRRFPSLSEALRAAAP